MQASTFKLKTNLLTGGRSHTPLAKSGGLTMGLNFYTVGRKNKLHTHPGEDHAFVVIEGQATFYDKDNRPTVLDKGQGIMLPDGYYYYFESTGTVPLAILRSSAARKDRPAVLRVDVKGDKRMEEEEGFAVADGEAIEGQYWEMK